MYFQVALLCYLGLTAIHAKPLDGFKCVDMSFRTSDPLTPTRTARICAPETSRDVPELERSMLDIDVPARHLLPPNEDYIGEHDTYSAAYPQEAYWPAPQSPKYLPTNLNVPTVGQPYTYQVINSVLKQQQQPIDFQPLEQSMVEQQTKLKSIVEDVSTVKESVSGLENYLKTVSGSLETLPEKATKTEVDLNIIMKLDPALEELLRTMLNLVSDKTIDETTIENNDKEFEEFMNYIRTADRKTIVTEKTSTERDSTKDDENSKKESAELDVENENKSESEDEEEVKKEKELEMTEEVENKDDYHNTDEELQNMLSEILGHAPTATETGSAFNDNEEEDYYLNRLFSSAADKNEAEDFENNDKGLDVREESDKISEQDLDEILNSAFARGQPLNDYADDAVTLLQLLTYIR